MTVFCFVRRFRHVQHDPVLQGVSLRGPVASRRAHGRAHARTRALQVRPMFCTRRYHPPPNVALYLFVYSNLIQSNSNPIFRSPGTSATGASPNHCRTPRTRATLTPLLTSSTTPTGNTLPARSAHRHVSTRTDTTDAPRRISPVSHRFMFSVCLPIHTLC